MNSQRKMLWLAVALLATPVIAQEPASQPGASDAPEQRPLNEEAAKQNAGEAKAETGEVATVNGEAITSDELPAGAPRQQALNQVVFTTLLEQGADKQNIEPKESEVMALQKKNIEGMKQRLEMTKQQVQTMESQEGSEQQVAQMKQMMAQLENYIAQQEANEGMDEQTKFMMTKWKFDQHLYKEFGGPVLMQRGGPEPLGAYIDWYAKLDEQNAVKVMDEELDNPLTNTFPDLEQFEGQSLPDEQAKQMMSSDWWNQPAPGQPQGAPQ